MLLEKFFKLTVLLIMLFFFISCSSSDDSKSESTSAFAPPSWIQGAWVDNVSSSNKSGYKFDSSDVYLIVFGQVTAGYVAAGAVTEHLTSTDSEFSYSSPVSGTVNGESFSGTLTYVFTKATTSTIALTGSSTTSRVSVTEGTYTKDSTL
tara:strand:- start:26 stop:475 length:450 start_codon:yes stop_codon:yes gene_type:complete